MRADCHWTRQYFSQKDSNQTASLVARLSLLKTACLPEVIDKHPSGYVTARDLLGLTPVVA